MNNCEIPCNPSPYIHACWYFSHYPCHSRMTRPPSVDHSARRSPNHHSPTLAPRPGPTTELRQPLSRINKGVSESSSTITFTGAQSALNALARRYQTSRHCHSRPVFWAPRRVQLEPGRDPHLEQMARHSLTRHSPSPAPRPGPSSEVQPPLSRIIRRLSGSPPVFAFNGAQPARYPLARRYQSSRHGHRRPVFWAPRRVQLESGRDPHLEQTARHSLTRRLPTQAPGPGPTTAVQSIRWPAGFPPITAFNVGPSSSCPGL